jgi:tRNA A-37 threonylcarbamoyl transferase component Bud32
VSEAPNPVTDDSDAELLAPGQEAGEYVIEGLLGSGGFARVYRAHHAVLSTPVAVKVITRALALDQEATSRFVREARAASRIIHPNVVRVLGFGKLADGRAYQVMELVDGLSLDEHLARHGRLPTEGALEILDAIALALDAAHAAGIVHRDIKPSNVLLSTSAGRLTPRLADFGIAKALEADETPHLTRTGTTLGTPIYMSPEQALGREVSPASDAYAFGVMAFELLSGHVPFEGESAFATMMMQVQAPPPALSSIAPELGKRFDDALGRLLAKHPGERPASLAAAMRELRARHQIDVAPSAPARSEPLPRRRIRARVLVAFGLAAVAAAVSLAVRWTRAVAPSEAPRRAPAAVVPAPPLAPAPAPPLAPAPAPLLAPAPAPPSSEPAAARVKTPGVEPAQEGTPPTPRPSKRTRGAPMPPSSPGTDRGSARKPAAVSPGDSYEAPPDYEPEVHP